MSRGRLWFLWALGVVGLLLLSCSGPGNRGGSGAVAGPGVVYIASPQGRVLAINPESRSRGLSFPDEGEWVSPEKRGSFIYASPFPQDQTLYVGSYLGEVYTLNAATGQPQGEKPLFQGAPIVAVPLLTPKGLLVASGDALFLLNPEGGAQLWPRPFRARGRLWASPVLLEDRVLAASLDHNLYAIDLARGEVAWSRSAQGGFTASPVVADGTVFAGSLDGNLYAWDGEGRPRWDPFQAGGWLWAPPLNHKGRLYFGDLKGNFYAVNAASGAREWSFVATGEVRAPAVAQEGKVFLATSLGWVYGLDEDKGALKWQRQLEGASPVNAPLLSWPGAILVPLANGQLYALEAETGKVIWGFPLKR